MSEMPDIIYVDNDVNKKRSLSPIYTHLLPLTTPYVRQDVAETLYDALKMAYMQDCGWVMHAQAAIEAYRKAKGE